MRVKKLLALALAGALSASMLAGCNRTLIEHQFHIDSVTNTETAVQTLDSNFALNLKRLNDLLKQHGASLSHSPYADFQYIFQVSFTEINSLEDLHVDSSASSNFIDFLTGNSEYFIVESTFDMDSANDINNYLQAVSLNIRKLYEAFEDTDLSTYELKGKQLMISSPAFLRNSDGSCTAVSLCRWMDGENLI